jgi:hypothetical protein
VSNVSSSCANAAYNSTNFQGNGNNYHSNENDGRIAAGGTDISSTMIDVTPNKDGYPIVG